MQRAGFPSQHLSSIATAFGEDGEFRQAAVRPRLWPRLLRRFLRSGERGEAAAGRRIARQVVNFAPRHRFGFLVGAADFLAAVPGECGRFPPVERHRLLIGWLVKTCVQDGVKTSDLMDPDAIELLAERLRTPLQIEMPFRLGEKRVSAEVFEQVLSRAIDELEPTLTRNGYDAPALTVLLRAKPAEVRDFLAGTLAADRTREFTEQLRVAGVPI
jgi:hypothetical protein